MRNIFVKKHAIFLIFTIMTRFLANTKAGSTTSLDIWCRVLCSPTPCRNSTIEDKITSAIIGNLQTPGVPVTTTVTRHTVTTIDTDQVILMFPMYDVGDEFLKSYDVHDVIIKARDITPQDSDSVILAHLRHIQGDIYLLSNYVNLVQRVSQTSGDTMVNGVVDSTQGGVFDAVPLLLYHITFVLFFVLLLVLIGLTIVMCMSGKTAAKQTSSITSRDAEYTAPVIQQTIPKTFMMYPTVVQFHDRKEIDLKLF